MNSNKLEKKPYYIEKSIFTIVSKVIKVIIYNY